MRILIAGGTSFVGRAIAWAAWHHGHDVTVVNRGVTPNDLPEKIERLVGDRQGDLSALADRTFDVTVDSIAFRPSDVERLASALGNRGGRHLQISSVSAYRDPKFAGANEASCELRNDEGLDLDGPITGASYGPLKAAAERAALEYFGDQLTVVRPTFVIGSHDATLRFPYWVERVRKGGDIAVPGPRENAMEYIDARDLANFVVHVAEEELTGAYHVAGPQPAGRFVEMVEQIATHLASPGTTIHEVNAERVVELHLASKFPLWTGAESENMLTLDSSLALSCGLDLRPLNDSVDDVTTWWGERAWPEHWLTSEDETRLLER
ncbi:MAG TPA: NAD-dependent epimerase/dehydratase family protein [Acidimicrobiales bacterium]|nr:NAD-dependent epimerase/dehydratase family protein [Acidimicrobiales bacterium]